VDERDRISEGRRPQGLFWIEGATHNDLYDKDAYVTPAIARLTDFFQAHLT